MFCILCPNIFSVVALRVVSCPNINAAWIAVSSVCLFSLAHTLNSDTSLVWIKTGENTRQAANKLWVVAITLAITIDALVLVVRLMATVIRISTCCWWLSCACLFTTVWHLVGLCSTIYALTQPQFVEMFWLCNRYTINYGLHRFWWLQCFGYLVFFLYKVFVVESPAEFCCLSLEVTSIS